METAVRLDGSQVHQELGVVLRSREGELQGSRDAELLVRSAAGEFGAKRAVSCLVEPSAGDSVLLAVPSSGPLYVLAILERSNPDCSEVVVDGDLKIRARGGRVTVAGASGVDLVSGGVVNVASPALRVHVNDGDVFMERLSYVGRALSSEVDRVRSVFGLVDNVFERLSQKLKRSYRRVEEVDTVRSGQIDYRADENLSLRGRNAVVNAEQLVKVDGGQIHLG